MDTPDIRRSIRNIDMKQLGLLYNDHKGFLTLIRDPPLVSGEITHYRICMEGIYGHYRMDRT